MGVIAAALIYVRDAFHLTTVMEEVLVIAVLIGVMGGAMIGGIIADRIGRRKNAHLGRHSFHHRFNPCAAVTQRLCVVHCARIARHCGWLHFRNSAGICIRARSAKIPRHAHRSLPIRPYLRHRHRRPGGLLVRSIARLALDVCFWADSSGDFSVFGSYGSRESSLVVCAKSG